MLTETAPSADDEIIRLGRDSAATQRALVRAARRRFATDGYRATTVRQIAADAGVNVALINRYFESKEGLFEACMQRTSTSWTPRPRPAHPTAMTSSSAFSHMWSMRPTATIHCNCCSCCAPPATRTPIASAAARWSTSPKASPRPQAGAHMTPETAPILLRAQLAIATMLGVVMLRTSAAVQPIATAGPDDLSEPLGQVLRLLLNATDT